MMRLSISLTHDERTMGWLFLTVQLFFLPWLLSVISAVLGWPSSVAMLNFLLFAINFIFTVLIFHRFLWQSLQLFLRSPFLCLRTAFFGLAGYYLASFVLGLLIQSIHPAYSNLNDANILSMTADHYALMAVGTVLLVPVVEETLYRGLIFGVLKEKNRLAAYLVSVPAFCLIHIAGYAGSYEPLQLLLSFIQYLPAGICLAWAYEKADSIWTPILMHITINQIALSVMR